MKVSDYIVSFFIEKGITDVFGYPGGMVTHLMDSFYKYRNHIVAHVTYHEQAASFAACGYAQTTGKPGVAYATSGPGATNLVTGIANAYFDSIPTIFITGQVNTYESRATLSVRQKGFQEMEVVEMCQNITKYCVYVDDVANIRYHLEKAYYYALEGRPGSVLLDIPMNIQRADIDPDQLKTFHPKQINTTKGLSNAALVIEQSLLKSSRPCILVGNGVLASGMGEKFHDWVSALGIPVVSSMLAVDILPHSPYYYGFIGAYGSRCANFIIAKSDLIISLGSRMDLRQIGTDKCKFAPNATLIRVDIDPNELTNQIKPDELDFCINLRELLPYLSTYITKIKPPKEWLSVCNKLKQSLCSIDEKREPNLMVEALSKLITSDCVVTTDVGQNQVWVAQSFTPNGQRVLFSGGHGAMGYSLPAAIGAYYGSRQNIFCFTGDGGLQMNIQELQVIARDKLPITIILLNNQSLGMIRHFQEMYFDGVYTQTGSGGGYTLPNFEKIAAGYNLPYLRITSLADIQKLKSSISACGPQFVEILLSDLTYVFPKLAMGKPNQDQDPELDRSFYEYLQEL